MRIGLDLDGVLYDFIQAAAKQLNFYVKRKVWDPQQEIPRWDFLESLYGKELWDRLMTVDCEKVFSQMLPYPKADHFVNQLAVGNDIRAITTRPALARKVTIENFLKDFTVVPSFFFTKELSEKAELDVDIYIEDHPKANNLWFLTGKPVVLIDRAWNRTDTDAKGTLRVYDYAQALRAITIWEEEGMWTIKFS